MHLADFDYHLPDHLIAQRPADRRDASRLLVLHRGGDDRAHRAVSDLPDLLAPGDLLVLNDTRVVAARLLGRRATGGKWEGLFVRQHPDGRWELLVQARGRLSAGEVLRVDGPAGDALGLALTEKVPPGRWLVRPDAAGEAPELLSRYGQVPIPPYIREGRADAGDDDRYQTVYARRDGGVAAPTAGLHFTPELFAALQRRGVERSFVTLHVGPGTFQPVKVEEVSDHRVEPEWGELPAETTSAIGACRRRGGRVVAVGTTSVRVLESAAPGPGADPVAARRGLIDLTITPPFSFRVVDALLTNFHLPRSSLLLLVAAFAGSETIRNAYREAVSREYRFYSYGDAMLILP